MSFQYRLLLWNFLLSGGISKHGPLDVLQWSLFFYFFFFKCRMFHQFTLSNSFLSGSSLAVNPWEVNNIVSCLSVSKTNATQGLHYSGLRLALSLASLSGITVMLLNEAASVISFWLIGANCNRRWIYSFKKWSSSMIVKISTHYRLNISTTFIVSLLVSRCSVKLVWSDYGTGNIH